MTPHGGDELAVLAAGLNAMAAELQQTGRDATERAEREHGYRETQLEFTDRLQVAGGEPEAHKLLQAHLQREIPASSVVVLARYDGGDRLEAGTPVPPGWELEERLASAGAPSCLAFRLARTHAEGEGRMPLMACEVCGKLAPSTACTPLLVGGEVIGSVLVGSQEALGPDDERRVAESVAQAAPVLANLRNLALAEARAATDALTGLPNRRALRDSLTRMLAQAGRTMSPLSVVALDLDHFKAINDTYGHDRGDAVLAAVGGLLTRSVRDSDLAARTGGEEFVVLLPDTGAEGALAVAEKLRTTIATVAGLGLSKALSASFGVATCPDHATDDSGLLRLADRALYTAKAAGRDRDRVEISGTARRAVPIDQENVRLLRQD